LDFKDIGLFIQHVRLYALPVRQASVLPAASFRFRLTTDTLAVQLTIPLIRLVWNFHPRETWYAGHTKKSQNKNNSGQKIEASPLFP